MKFVFNIVKRRHRRYLCWKADMEYIDQCKFGYYGTPEVWY